MGMAIDQLRIIAKLCRELGLNKHLNVVDFGCQQLFHARPPEIVEFFKSVGADITPAQSADFSKDGVHVGPMFKAMNWDYTALDILDAPHCRRFDANTDTIPKDMLEKSDFVLNFGTSEHIMNQYNVFKSMHDCAKSDGIMFGLFLTEGYADHGLFSYKPRFVDKLLAANEYEIVHVTHHQSKEGNCRWIAYRKTSSDPFIPAMD